MKYKYCVCDALPAPGQQCIIVHPVYRLRRQGDTQMDVLHGTDGTLSSLCGCISPKSVNPLL